MQGGSEAKPTPTNKGDRGKVKNLPFDEALDLSTSDASLSRGPSEQRGAGAKDEAVSNQRFDEAAPSEAKDEAGRGGSEGNASAAKGERGVVKDKPFDEAHDLGDDDLSSEGSVETNDSEPNQPARAASPHASNAATNAAVKSTIGECAIHFHCSTHAFSWDAFSF